MDDKTKENKKFVKIPIVAIRGSVVFPHTDVPLAFGRTKSVSAINKSFQDNRIVAIFTQKDPRTSDPTKDDLYKIGTIATITQMMTTEGEMHVLVRGKARVSLIDLDNTGEYLVGDVVSVKESGGSSSDAKASSKQLLELFKRSINLGKQVEIMAVMKLVSGSVVPGELVDNVASFLEIKTSQRQKLLEDLSVSSRIKKVTELLSSEVNIMDLERTIDTKTQERFQEQMRKTMLLEKKKTIERELGESDESFGPEGEFKEYEVKIKKSGMPKDTRKKAEKELKKLSQLSPHNPEGAYIRNYLDWLVDMPWDKSSKSKNSIKKAAKILEDRHYGMQKAKDRIVEYLAVMKIKETKKESENHPTILCFIGPPGVGKTSIGKSIAQSLGRKFVRISLGGIRDEAEIRGHRRTYVGALPGRIIQGIKNAGTKNPVFMLDEIDKLGQDFRGDPSSALLETLDPEQNKEFSDHYLEVPFDLSEVMFIATGNVLDSIPPALRDRMEVISFPGYTEHEKYSIAQKFLWPKQLKLHGLEDIDIKIHKEALEEVINKYTREAGVRNLERNFATICRKIARLVAEKKKYSKTVGKTSVRKYLGPRKFNSLVAEKQDEVGMVTGLSVTSAGGEILFIEVSLMPGKGKLTLTGQLGDVMKESARAALTWAKAHWEELGLREEFGKDIDVHIHVPEGAVPKDGPSAGVSMATALVSALTGIKVKRDVGMTGEVTLRGRVLEIGGVKEKVLAGHRASLKTIILPKENKKDMEDIPEKIKKDIKFVFADRLEDVLFIALAKMPSGMSKKTMKKVYRVPTVLAVN